MDQHQYRTIVKQVLTEHYELAEEAGVLDENVLVFDEDRSYALYKIANIGIDELHRVSAPL